MLLPPITPTWHTLIHIQLLLLLDCPHVFLHAGAATMDRIHMVQKHSYATTRASLFFPYPMLQGGLAPGSSCISNQAHLYNTRSTLAAGITQGITLTQPQLLSNDSLLQCACVHASRAFATLNSRAAEDCQLRIRPMGRTSMVHTFALPELSSSRCFI